MRGDHSLEIETVSVEENIYGGKSIIKPKRRLVDSPLGKEVDLGGNDLWEA